MSFHLLVYQMSFCAELSICYSIQAYPSKFNFFLGGKNFLPKWHKNCVFQSWCLFMGCPWLCRAWNQGFKPLPQDWKGRKLKKSAFSGGCHVKTLRKILWQGLLITYFKRNRKIGFHNTSLFSLCWNCKGSSLLANLIFSFFVMYMNSLVAKIVGGSSLTQGGQSTPKIGTKIFKKWKKWAKSLTNAVVFPKPPKNCRLQGLHLVHVWAPKKCFHTFPTWTKYSTKWLLKISVECDINPGIQNAVEAHQPKEPLCRISWKKMSENFLKKKSVMDSDAFW